MRKNLICPVNEFQPPGLAPPGFLYALRRAIISP